MSISHLLSRKPETDLKRNLQRGRMVLAGLDEWGNKVTDSMFDEGVISFAHGEGMQRPHPDTIYAGVDALLETEESSLENYKFLQNPQKLYARIKEDFMALGIDEETAGTICDDAGSSRLFCGFFQATSNPGDVFLTSQTYYHSLVNWCDIYNAKLESVLTERVNDYKMTAANIERWIAEHKDAKVKGIVIFNPTITGAIYTREELSDIADCMEKHDLLAISDITFVHTEFDGRKSPQLAAFKKAKDRTLTLNGVAKTMGLANIRYGWGCGPKELVDRVRSYMVATSFTVPHIARAMALAAMENAEICTRANTAECMARSLLISEQCERVNRKLSQSLGLSRVYPFLDISFMPKASQCLLMHMNGFVGAKTPEGEVIQDSVDMTRYMMKTAKVALSPGISFGFTDCTVRLSYGCMGAEHTYPFRKKAEIFAAVRAVVKNFPALSYILPGDEEIPRLYFNSPGFAEGRRQIAEAFEGRMEAALLELVQANKAHFMKKTAAGEALRGSASAAPFVPAHLALQKNAA